MFYARIPSLDREMVACWLYWRALTRDHTVKSERLKIFATAMAAASGDNTVVHPSPERKKSLLINKQ